MSGRERSGIPKIRTNPFTEGRYSSVAVTPLRMSRPWLGQIQTPLKEEELPDYDKNCPLCPGNHRKSGEANPDYKGTFTFNNDTPIFYPVETREEVPSDSAVEQTFFREIEETGISEVVCYCPDHNKAMINMTPQQIESVIHTWMTRYQVIGDQPFINHVAILETRGKELGNSQDHPHGQIWAQEHLPPAAQIEVRKQTELSNALGGNAMLAYLKAELKKDERVVFANEDFGVVVPFWAAWPYETMVIPTKPVNAINKLTDRQVSNLAEVLWMVPNMYGTLFNRPLNGAPYTLGIHQQPTDGSEYTDYQMYLHFVTPMLTPDRIKHHAAYGEEFGLQRDFTAERAAEELRGTISKLPQH